MSQSDRGIIMLAMGWRHNVVAAVSLWTLRKHWSGPVTIFHDTQAAMIVKQIAEAANADAVLIDPVRQKRNSHYAAKPALPQLSPYRFTIQVDTDTIWAASPQPLFDMLTPQVCIVTQFGGWESTGPKMRGRIEGWRKADPERVERSLAKAWPALNTGVVAYGNESIVAREVWMEETLKQPSIFMADELSFQILVPDYEQRPDLLLVTDDRFNCCPRFGTRKADAVVWHFHGHQKLDRLPEYRALWEPAFREAWACDFAGIQSWVRQGAKGWIESYLT